MRLPTAFPLLTATLALALLGAAPVEAADAAPKKPTAAATKNEIAPPLGFWSHGKSGLYLSITPASADTTDELVIGKRALQLGGPPPTQGKADDVFIIAKHERSGNRILASGSFNWDADSRVIELEITWTTQGVTVNILKNPGYELYPVGTYALKKRKGS